MSRQLGAMNDLLVFSQCEHFRVRHLKLNGIIRK